MSTLEIAKKYVELCKKGEYHQALEALFSKDAVSVEAADTPGFPRETKGLPAIIEKGKRWADNHEVHSASVDGPWPNGDRFIVRFVYDITNKPSGKRIKMEEGALFTIENGKIVREEFFYAMG